MIDDWMYHIQSRSNLCHSPSDFRSHYVSPCVQTKKTYWLVGTRANNDRRGKITTGTQVICSCTVLTGNIQNRYFETCQTRFQTRKRNLVFGFMFVGRCGCSRIIKQKNKYELNNIVVKQRHQLAQGLTRRSLQAITPLAVTTY